MVEVGWLQLSDIPREQRGSRRQKINKIDMPHDAAGYAARLYAAFHEMDHVGVEYIVVDLPPHGDAWLAIHDRLPRGRNERENNVKRITIESLQLLDPFD